MNELDNLMGKETSPVVLKDLMDPPLEMMTLPEGARRNRAAQIALLCPDPSKSVDNYSTMMAEDTGTLLLSLKVCKIKLLAAWNKQT